MKVQFVPRSKHFLSIIKTSQLMLYSEIIAVCSEIHTKHIVWAAERRILNVKLPVRAVATSLSVLRIVLHEASQYSMTSR
jgi:hypothetical protein